MDTDRNLLFGVLALQADLIDAPQFIEACLLWSTRKSECLADLLLGRGWIEPADRAHIEYLLERKLQKHGGDARASLAALPDDIKRSLAALGDDFQRSLSEAPLAATSQLTTIDHVPACAERYCRLRLHATGGIGRVWLAHDSELGRDVALKELRPERAVHPSLGARFLQEAQITGQLEHPGIIPVYELVRAREGQQPFYTMRFVRGRTLSAAARDYHDKRLAGDADALALPALLNAFVTVCNTVAYAHSRGVIHRDLKGQNVIMGDFGEVVVLDWGLAKLVGRPEGEAHVPAVVLAEIGADTGYTVPGQALGTPAYMAPEQAAGQLDLIDQRTDVHGLGAILYEILTGTPPFAGGSTEEVLRKVREEAPAPPRQFWAEAPPALALVCLQALAKHPADRPAGAADLAQKVQGWQEFERRKAEAALRESEAMYQSLVQSIPQLMLCKDLEGRFTFANQKFCAELGQSLEEIKGKTDYDLFERELAEKYRRDDKLVIESGSVLDLVEEHVTPRGEKLYVQVMKTPLVGPDGKTVGVQGMFWDVTARKRAEQELAHERYLLDTLMDNLPDAIYFKDSASRFIRVNKAAAVLLGLDDPAQVVSKTHFDFFADENAQRTAADDQEIMRTGRPLVGEDEKITWPGGRVGWLSTTKMPFRDRDGAIIGTFGVSRDITRRKQAEIALQESEERYRSVIAAMQDGILLLDADGSVRDCNASAKSILGLSADQLRGGAPLDACWGAIREDGSPFPDEARPPVVTLRTGEPCSNVIAGVRRPDGTLTWLSVNSRPLFHADGTTLAGVLACFADVTDRRRTEESLRQTTLELTRLQQRLERSGIPSPGPVAQT
jgi:PAS domain S-box-containing protein